MAASKPGHTGTASTAPPRIALPSRSSSRTILLAEAVLAGAAIGVPFFFGSFDSITGRAVACLTMTALVCLLALRPIGVQFWSDALPVLLPISLAHGWVLSVGLFEPDAWLAPDMAAANMIGAAAGTLALLAGVIIGRRGGAIKALIDILLVMLAAEIAVSLLAKFGMIEGLPPIEVARDNGRLIGLAGNANIQAVIAGSAILLALGRVIPHFRRYMTGVAGLIRNPAPLFYLAIIIIGTAALLLTGSRFPLVSGALLLGILMVRAMLRGVSRARIGVLAGLILLLSAICLAGLSDLVLRRFEEIDTGTAIRAEMWWRYLSATTNAIWTGFGPGGFPILNARVLPDPLVAAAAWTVNSPHNVVLQLLLKGGLPYFILLVTAACLMALPVVSYFASQRRSAEAWAIALTAFYLLANGMVDICLDVPGTICLAMMLTGLLWGEATASNVVDVAKT